MNKILFICIFILSSVTFAAGSSVGVFMVVKGDIKLQRSSASPIAVKQAMEVEPGDTVISGVDSRAKISMKDRNVLYISPSTKITIAKYDDGKTSGTKSVELNLHEGKVLNNVQQKYDGETDKYIIKTPTAVAGVRGTSFITSFDKATNVTQVITQSGVVSFASTNAQGKSSGEVQVKKGEGSSVGTNTPPEPPKTIPPDQMKQIESDVTGQTPPPGAPVLDDSKKGKDKKTKDDSSGGKRGTTPVGDGRRANIGSDKAPEAVDQIAAPTAPSPINGGLPGVIKPPGTGTNTTVTDAIRNRTDSKSNVNVVPVAPKGR